MSESSLRWWTWKLGSTSGAGSAKAKPQAMSPLTFVEMTATVQRAPIEVVLAGGIRVIVPPDFDDAALERVLAVLDRRR